MHAWTLDLDGGPERLDRPPVMTQLLCRQRLDDGVQRDGDRERRVRLVGRHAPRCRVQKQGDQRANMKLAWAPAVQQAPPAKRAWHWGDVREKVHDSYYGRPIAWALRAFL